ncbi:MAG: OmpA family protein [Deltaproteobacteria bacterium]|nr:OmpA family protein [Deltaproteobacteria bacterium]
MLRTVVLSLLGLVILSSRAESSSLDLAAWLARPGVRLLAVEFYATWCKPCMEAVPRWKALHDKYRSKGLRLIVVATQDPQGGCVNPGWNPDDVICDDDGRLAERLGAENLPSAYLWSWQGNLLAGRVHVADVEPMIEAWLSDVPRVEVEVQELAKGASISKHELEGLVRSRLRDEDKLEVIATDAERRRLAELKKKSFQVGFDEKLQCELGKDLSANSLVEVSIVGESRKRLRLGLLSAERGCLVASSVVDFLPDKAAVSVAEAVTELGGKLRREVQLPGVIGSAGMAEYARLKRELEQAKAEGARAKSSDEARQKTILEAWKIVKDFASIEAISLEKRTGALDKFLADFPENHAHRQDAQNVLSGLRAQAATKRPPDQDQDGIPDATDSCPAQAETVNGINDGDGCPDDVYASLLLSRPDSDGDGLPDDKDACGAEAEDLDGFADGDGCPDPDNDADGAPDDRDSCPGEAEDVDGFEDSDGCPDADNDVDGVSDRDDRCPNEPETKNGFEDLDGCPDRGRVEIHGSLLQLAEPVKFKTNRAEILPESFGVLDAVVSVLQGRADLRVRVEGHTDDRGRYQANVELSAARAQSVVRYLSNKGVAPSRLESVGFGPARPIAPNDDEASRARNRRIELVILPE